MSGHYNQKHLGIITKDFLEDIFKDNKVANDKYIIIRGYFDQGNTEKNGCLKLSEILNFVYSKGFSFDSFISRSSEKTFGEMLFSNDEKS